GWIGELVHSDIVEGDVDVPPLSRTSCTKQGRRHREGHGDAGEVVDQRKTHAGGRPSRFAGKRKESGLRLQQIVVGGPRRTLTGAPVARQISADERLLDLAQ